MVMYNAFALIDDGLMGYKSRKMELQASQMNCLEHNVMMSSLIVQKINNVHDITMLMTSSNNA